MLRDAETFADEDKKAKEKIDSRNALDSYLNSMKSTVEDPKKLADIAVPPIRPRCLSCVGFPCHVRGVRLMCHHFSLARACWSGLRRGCL